MFSLKKKQSIDAVRNLRHPRVIGTRLIFAWFYWGKSTPQWCIYCAHIKMALTEDTLANVVIVFFTKIKVSF